MKDARCVICMKGTVTLFEKELYIDGIKPVKVFFCIQCDRKFHLLDESHLTFELVIQRILSPAKGG